MANLYGYEYESSEDIRKRIMEDYQARLQANGALGERQANVIAAVQNIFGAPGMTKARQVEGTLKGVLENFQDDPNKDPLENEMARAQAIRNAMAGVSPEIALTANDRYLKARAELDERKKLLSDRDRAASEEERRANEAAREGRWYLMQRNAKGTETAIATFEETEYAKAKEAWDAAQRGDPKSEYTLVQGDPDGGFGDQKGLGGGVDLTPTGQQAAIKRLISVDSLARQSQAVAEDLKANLFAADPKTGELLVSGSTWIQAVDNAKSTFLESSSDYQADSMAVTKAESRVSEYLKDEGVVNRIKAAGKETSVVRAQILSLAYVLAKSLDPGGRLSDQDVTMAIEMIAGNRTPEAMMALFKRRLEQAYEDVQYEIDLARDGYLTGPYGVRQLERLDANKAFALRTFEEVMKAAGQLSIDGSTPAAKATEQAPAAPTGASDASATSTRLERDPVTGKIRKAVPES